MPSHAPALLQLLTVFAALAVTRSGFLTPSKPDQVPPELTSTLSISGNTTVIIGPGQFQIQPLDGYGFDVWKLNQTCIGDLIWCVGRQNDVECLRTTKLSISDSQLKRDKNEIRVKDGSQMTVNSEFFGNITVLDPLYPDEQVYMSIRQLPTHCTVYLVNCKVQIPVDQFKNDSEKAIIQFRVVAIIVVTLACVMVLITVVSLFLMNWYTKRKQLKEEKNVEAEAAEKSQNKEAKIAEKEEHQPPQPAPAASKADENGPKNDDKEEQIPQKVAASSGQ